jgi:hypothetical protein
MSNCEMELYLLVHELVELTRPYHENLQWQAFSFFKCNAKNKRFFYIHVFHGNRIPDMVVVFV